MESNRSKQMAAQRDTEGEHRTSRRQLLRTSAGGAAMAGIAFAARGQGQEAEAADKAGIVGAWIVAVPQDGVMPKPAYDTFFSAASFMADGTFITQFDSADANVGAALGCGVWAQTAERAYVSTFASVEYDPKSGAPTDIAKVYQEITLDPSGDRWKARARIAILGLDGAVMNISPAIEVRATRVDLGPLPA